MGAPAAVKTQRGKRIRGQGMVEYTFIISLVALALVLAFNSLGLQLTDFFDSANTKISALLK